MRDKQMKMKVWRRMWAGGSGQALITAANTQKRDTWGTTTES